MLSKKLFHCLISTSIALSAPSTWAARTEGAEDKPLANSSAPYSKMLGFVVTDGKGKTECAKAISGQVQDVPQCNEDTTQKVIAAAPRNGDPNVKNAGLPIILAGAALVCAGGGILKARAEKQNSILSEAAGDVLTYGGGGTAAFAAGVEMDSGFNMSRALFNLRGAGAFGATIAVCAIAYQGGKKAYLYFTQEDQPGNQHPNPTYPANRSSSYR